MGADHLTACDPPSVTCLITPLVPDDHHPIVYSTGRWFPGAILPCHVSHLAVCVCVCVRKPATVTERQPREAASYQSRRLFVRPIGAIARSRPSLPPGEIAEDPHAVALVRSISLIHRNVPFLSAVAELPSTAGILQPPNSTPLLSPTVFFAFHSATRRSRYYGIE